MAWFLHCLLLLKKFIWEFFKMAKDVRAMLNEFTGGLGYFSEKQLETCMRVAT